MGMQWRRPLHPHRMNFLAPTFVVCCVVHGLLVLAALLYHPLPFVSSLLISLFISSTTRLSHITRSIPSTHLSLSPHKAEKSFEGLTERQIFDRSTEMWGEIESDMFDGQKLPDWHNAKTLRQFLVQHPSVAAGGTGGTAEVDYPLLSAVYDVAYGGESAAIILDCLRGKRGGKEGGSSLSESKADDGGGAAKTGGCTVVPGVTGQRALVTGGVQGIGRAIADHLVAAGAHVVVLDRNAAALDELRMSTAASGAPIGTICADLLNVEQVRAEVSASIAKDGPFTLVVNNAGFAKFAPFFDKATVDDFGIHYDINVKAAVLLTQIMAAALKESGQKGSVVHVTSQSSSLALKDHLGEGHERRGRRVRRVVI